MELPKEEEGGGGSRVTVSPAQGKPFHSPRKDGATRLGGEATDCVGVGVRVCGSVEVFACARVC